MQRIVQPPEKIAENHYLFTIEHKNAQVMPGQFINIRICNFTDPLLRRPFSVFDYDGENMSVVFKIAGRATAMMKDHFREGDEIDVIGPKGNGFTLVSDKRVLIAGGGVGNAPLYYLAQVLYARGCDVYFVYGSRSKDFVFFENRFSSLSSHVQFCTDDGTFGTKGTVTDAVNELLKTTSFDHSYICGPEPMMKSAAAALLASSGSIEVSLENYFGCGIGICSGCTVRTTHGQKRACVDGPCFDARTMLWQ